MIVAYGQQSFKRKWSDGRPRPYSSMGAGRGRPALHRQSPLHRNCRMVKLPVPAHSLRLLAIHMHGTLLNPEFRISETDLATLRRAQAQGIEVILVTGRRHTFALPIAQQLGFDLWLISSNGAVTRSLAGETFHRDLLPAPICRELVGAMQEFRGQTVLTFDSNVLHGAASGTIVIERLDELEASIQRWREKNMQYIKFVVPIEN